MNFVRYVRKKENGERILSTLPNIFDDKILTYHIDQIRNFNNNDKLQVFNIGYERCKPGSSSIDVRTHRFRLYYVVEGCGTFNDQPVKEGQGFFTWENEKHSYVADLNTPWCSYWITFCGKEAAELVSDYTDFTTNYPVFNIPAQNKIIPMLNDAIYGDHSDTNIEQYLIGLLHTVLSYHGYAHSQAHPIDTEINLTGNCEKTYRQAVEIIENRFNTELTIADIANELHICQQYLNLIFKKATGISPKEYLIKCRMENAEHLLLHSDCTISEIAMYCGYTDSFNFTKLFKKRYGMSPTTYRIKKR